jgi:PDZ domain-containing secreted protein
MPFFAAMTLLLSNPMLPRHRRMILGTALPFICCVGLAWADTAVPPAPLPAGRGYLGVIITEICPEVRAQTALKEGEGLMIGRIAPDSPAAALGLLHYDILTKFNDQWLMSPAQFVTLVENAGPGSEVEITYLRQGVEQKAKVILGSFPANAAAVAAPLPEEMLSSVIRSLRDNPAVLEAVYRQLQNMTGGPRAGAFALQHGSRLTLRDAIGEVELTIVGTSQQLRAWDKAGQLVFEGPCNTALELEAVPAEVRPRLERLQKECLSGRTLPVQTAKEPADTVTESVEDPVK